MKLLGLFLFLCVAIAVALADVKEDAKKLLEMVVECRRKNNIADDDVSNMEENPTTNQKCALACVFKSFKMLEVVDGKPEINEAGMEKFAKAMRYSDEKLAQSAEIVKVCKAEAASITDECEYVYASSICMKREGKARNVELGFA